MIDSNHTSISLAPGPGGKRRMDSEMNLEDDYDELEIEMELLEPQTSQIEEQRKQEQRKKEQFLQQHVIHALDASTGTVQYRPTPVPSQTFHGKHPFSGTSNDYSFAKSQSDILYEGNLEYEPSYVTPYGTVLHQPDKEPRSRAGTGSTVDNDDGVYDSRRGTLESQYGNYNGNNYNGDNYNGRPRIYSDSATLGPPQPQQTMLRDKTFSIPSEIKDQLRVQNLVGSYGVITNSAMNDDDDDMNLYTTYEYPK